MTSTATFAGFGPETLTFLRELGANNSKAWFDAHRADYEAHYLAPAFAFIEAMREPLAAIAPDVHADPRVNGSLFRINRDVRFSKDKTPYKDHLDIFFWLGEGRSRERPGLFFRLREDELMLGAGMHGFDKRLLEAYREAVVDPKRGAALEEAAAAAEEAGAPVEGVGYKRVPSGFDADHPRARFLLHNALHAGYGGPLPDELGTPALIDYCAKRFRPLAPLAQWIAAL